MANSGTVSVCQRTARAFGATLLAACLSWMIAGCVVDGVTFYDISGTVVDAESRQPLAGAVVSMASTLDLDGVPQFPTVTVADAAGSFNSRQGGPGWGYTIGLDVPGFVKSNGTPVPPPLDFVYIEVAFNGEHGTLAVAPLREQQERLTDDGHTRVIALGTLEVDLSSD